MQRRTVTISRGGASKRKGAGFLNEDDVNIVNMTKLTICGVDHSKDDRNKDSFFDVFDFDAITPSLEGNRLREWLLVF